jgi:hypothetical protein
MFTPPLIVESFEDMNISCPQLVKLGNSAECNVDFDSGTNLKANVDYGDGYNETFKIAGNYKKND